MKGKLFCLAAVVLLAFNNNPSERISRSSSESLNNLQHGSVQRSFEVLDRSAFGFTVRDLTTKEIQTVATNQDLQIGSTGVGVVNASADGLNLTRWSEMPEPGKNQELGVVESVALVNGYGYVYIHGDLVPVMDGVDLTKAVGQVAYGSAEGVLSIN